MLWPNSVIRDRCEILVLASQLHDHPAKIGSHVNLKLNAIVTGCCTISLQPRRCWAANNGTSMAGQRVGEIREPKTRCIRLLSAVDGMESHNCLYSGTGWWLYSPRIPSGCKSRLRDFTVLTAFSRTPGFPPSRQLVLAPVSCDRSKCATLTYETGGMNLPNENKWKDVWRVGAQVIRQCAFVS